MDDDDDEDRVGYGKPPRRTRFKPGQSGNRKGRPKGAEGRKAMVKRVAGELHRVTEHGKPRWRSTLELVLLLVRARASTGDVKAFATFEALLTRFGVEPPDHSNGAYIFMPELPTDQELDQYAEKSQERQRKMKEEYEASLRSETRSPHRRKS